MAAPFLNERPDPDHRPERPVLVVKAPAERLVRRGLLAPSDAAAPRWAGARVLVFRRGPVVCERALR